MNSRLLKTARLLAPMATLLLIISCARQSPDAEQTQPTSPPSVTETSRTTDALSAQVSTPMVTQAVAAPTDPTPAIPSPSPVDLTGSGGQSSIPASPQATISSPQTIAADMSGPQTALSDFERLAAGRHTYSGILCFVTEQFTCECSQQETLISDFTFTDPNTARWVLESSGDTVVTFEMRRLGINTWQGAINGQGGIVLDVQLVFVPSGYQQLSTVRFPTGEAPACAMLWTRQD